ncbi:GtrA family protein [Stenotrophomonas sp. SORGH_AS_0321]|uniref:GtrA family protein n=1 Tax=Stenotrophomonas sp. SORGH_AS_0321 TaxID=3041787 RepID=UPI00285B17EC|nr:GtrA family protein [Stenotrophomonas sp. SORGH_AS_0321]MDR6095859.1 putative flippase GtrA [Stenotrophomonas sp. SORGH_AS_0321]
MKHMQIIRFLVAGGIAACANFGSRILLGLFAPYVTSIVIAYIIGMATAFTLNRLFVFTSAENSLGSQAGWFVLINVAAILQTVAISLLLARWVFPLTGFHYHPETAAHAVGVIVPVLTSYIGHKHLSFRQRR